MTAPSPKILLVHGLFMRATMMMPLATRLRRQGFVCLALTYPTRQQTLHDSVAQHLPRIQDFAADAPPWDPAIPLLSIAGTKSFGIGSTLRLFAADEPNDGTVAVAETELPEAAAYHRLPTTHTALQFDSDAAQLVNAWFRNVSPPRATLAVTEK